MNEVSAKPRGRSRLKRAATVRRMGPANTPTWHAILDGAEAILREEGGAGVNANKIAERIGVKRQLVYYYFVDLDDLLVQLFNRTAARSLAQLREAAESDHPLAALWKACAEAFDQALILEFQTLANHNREVRNALLTYADTAKGLQIIALQRAIDRGAFPGLNLSPAAIAHVTTWVALGLQREAALGLGLGHSDILNFVGNLLKAENKRS